MSKFATDRVFDGQRASLGREVVVRFAYGEIEAGIIAEVRDDDGLAIRGLRSDKIHLTTAFISFVPTKEENDINALLEGSWTWPVRV